MNRVLPLLSLLKSRSFMFSPLFGTKLEGIGQHFVCGAFLKDSCRHRILHSQSEFTFLYKTQKYLKLKKAKKIMKTTKSKLK